MFNLFQMAKLKRRKNHSSTFVGRRRRWKQSADLGSGSLLQEPTNLNSCSVAIIHYHTWKPSIRMAVVSTVLMTVISLTTLSLNRRLRRRFCLNMVCPLQRKYNSFLLVLLLANLIMYVLSVMLIFENDNQNLVAGVSFFSCKNVWQ